MLVETVLHNKGSDVVTIRPSVTVGEAARVMVQHRIGAAIVTEPDGGGERVVGVFSERDIMRGLAQHGEAVHGKQVRELMSANVVTCSPQDSLDRLMVVMTSRRVRHLPVIAGGQLRGIITIGDIVKNRLDEATLEAESLRDYVMGHSR